MWGEAPQTYNLLILFFSQLAAAAAHRIRQQFGKLLWSILNCCAIWINKGLSLFWVIIQFSYEPLLLLLRFVPVY